MKRKNILFILCDQLCADVLEVYGGKVKTPNISRIAENGVTFSSCYCQTPLCTPSRAAMINGLYPHQSGIVSNVMRLDYPTVGGPETEEGICDADRTTEQVLFQNGWQTRHIGKWHLSGEQLSCYPDMFREHQEYGALMRERFDRIASSLPRENYMDWYGWKLPVTVSPTFAAAAEKISDKWKKVPRLNDFYAKIGRLDLPEEDTYDWQIGQRSVQTLDALDGESPFMLTCSFNMPHDPNVVPSPYYEEANTDTLWDWVEWPCEERYQEELSGELPRQAGKEFLREFQRVYTAAVMFVDKQVGRILDALERSGRKEDTIVVFTADHGDMAGAHGMFWKSTSAFYEQVARVPLLISCPGALRNTRCDTPVGLLDLPNTLLDFCGLTALPESEGVSLLPLLFGEKISHPPVLSERLEWPEGNRRCRHSGDKTASFMLRDGAWKYVLHINEEQAECFLFNLEQDPAEIHNLAVSEQYAELRSQLHRRLSERLLQTGYHLQPIESR